MQKLLPNLDSTLTTALQANSAACIMPTERDAVPLSFPAVVSISQRADQRLSDFVNGFYLSDLRRRPQARPEPRHTESAGPHTRENLKHALVLPGRLRSACST